MGLRCFVVSTVKKLLPGSLFHVGLEGVFAESLRKYLNLAHYATASYHIRS